MVELGNKHECLNCSTKFYDLGKSELICPKCGADQKELEGQEEVKKQPRPARKKSAAAKKTRKAEPAAAEEDDSPDKDVEPKDEKDDD